MVRFRFLDCGFVIVGSWCPVKLLRVFLLWLVLLALPSQGMGAGILADCERAHTTTKKLRKMQPQRPPTAARAGHEHCHDHHARSFRRPLQVMSVLRGSSAACDVGGTDHVRLPAEIENTSFVSRSLSQLRPGPSPTASSAGCLTRIADGEPAFAFVRGGRRRIGKTFGSASTRAKGNRVFRQQATRTPSMAQLLAA